MEKIMIASVIAVISFWVGGKPWVLPPDTGPINQPPAIEKPINKENSPAKPCRDYTKAIPNSPGTM